MYCTTEKVSHIEVLKSNALNFPYKKVVGFIQILLSHIVCVRMRLVIFVYIDSNYCLPTRAQIGMPGNRPLRSVIRTGNAVNCNLSFRFGSCFNELKVMVNHSPINHLFHFWIWLVFISNRRMGLTKQTISELDESSRVRLRLSRSRVEHIIFELNEYRVESMIGVSCTRQK